MSREVIEEVVRHDPPLLHADELIESAVRRLLDCALPALPVVDGEEHLVGIFGEREFIEAVFPGYLNQLRHTAFVPRSLDDVLEKRQACRLEPVGKHMNRERLRVGPEGSDTQIAEIFLHHRVLIIPVVDGQKVTGLITRHAFFNAAAERFLSSD
jgi:CBS domain-containing protein